MDAAGKAAAEAAVGRLHQQGSTNIWEGLRVALDALYADKEAAALVGRQQTLMLLTDGQPNVAPPSGSNDVAGHLKALKGYAAQHGNALPTICTFGFGYNLDSNLLLQLAKTGGGTFAFIPVTPVMGTVFVHAIANALSMYVPNATISISLGEGVSYNIGKKKGKGKDKHHVLPGGIVPTIEPWGLTIETGPLQCGTCHECMISVVVVCVCVCVCVSMHLHRKRVCLCVCVCVNYLGLPFVCVKKSY